MPGGQFSVRTPQSSTIGLFAPAKLEIQTLSLPSISAAQGPGRPPTNGEPGYSVPSGRSSVTLPPPVRCLNIARVSVSSALPPSFKVAIMSAITKPPRIELPSRFVTQTLPWLSIPSPLPLHPVLNFSTLVGSEAGKRVTCPPNPLVTQILSCWSIPRWNGPRNDLQGSTSRPSQTILPLVISPLGK